MGFNQNKRPSIPPLYTTSLQSKQTSFYTTIVLLHNKYFCVLFSETPLSFWRCLYCEKLYSQPTNATGIQIASETTAESRGKRSLMFSQNACRFKGEGTALGGNCIYLRAILHVALLMDAQDLVVIAYI